MRELMSSLDRWQQDGSLFEFGLLNIMKALPNSSGPSRCLSFPPRCLRVPEGIEVTMVGFGRGSPNPFGSLLHRLKVHLPLLNHSRWHSVEGCTFLCEPVSFFIGVPINLREQLAITSPYGPKLLCRRVSR